MAKTSLYAAIIFCICTDTCLAYRFVGSESLSDALVAHHYSINDRLDAVIVVDPTMPTFEYHTYYAMGYADEPEGEQGRLHFLEHIIAGMGSRPSGELNQLIMRNGGQHLAYTAHHMTYFTMRFPRDKLALAVEIDRDRFYRTLFDMEFIDNEKQVVLTELSRNSTRSRRRFSRQFWGLVYGREKFNGVGTAALIEGIKPGDLQQLFHNVLRRKRRLVVVIGDVDEEDVLTKLAEAFPSRDRPKGDRSPLSRFPNPDALGESFHVRFKSQNRTRFKKAWHIPALGHPDYASFRVLASILSRPSNSLRSSLLDSQVVRSFSVWASSYRGFGFMGCNAELVPVRSTRAVENAIRARLEQIKTQGITDSELAAGRNIQLRHRYSQLQDRSDTAWGFGAAFAGGGDPLLYPRLIRQIRRVNADDIQRIVGEHLIDAKSITLSWTLKEEHPFGAQIAAAVVLILAIGATVFIIVWTIRKAIRRFTGEAVCSEQPPENLI
ncbi:MAG: insulinase family protein [Gemmatimonadetes bacterium]|nr:insulinase family protein [Gemmatimonadota bacterium]